MADRPGFNEMEREIQESGGRFGGCWAPLDFGTYCPRTCELLLSLFPIRTVLDVGCGFGSHLRLFRSLGCTVVGIEPLKYAASRCGMPVIRHDLEASPLILDGIDLAFSVEAAEHISKPAYFIATMASAPVVFFSAAGPGQEGHHHVTLKSQEWWIDQMEDQETFGYKYQPVLTEKLRQVSPGYVGMNGMLFVRTDHLDRYGLLRGDYE